MATELEKCEQQVKKLSLQERETLIRRLIEGLDISEERDLEQLWIEEAVRRLELHRQGKIASRPAPEVFADARARLRELQ